MVGGWLPGKGSHKDLGSLIVGLFVGPVVLAVAYRLVAAWVDEQDLPAAVPSAPPVPRELAAED